MVLKILANIDDYCLKAAPRLGVFSSRKWLSIYGEQLRLVGIFKESGELIGGFYFLSTKKFGFKFLKLPPYTPHCGLFFVSDSKNKSAVTSFSKEVMSQVCDYITAEKSALTVLAFPSEIIDLQPFIWNKYKVVPNYTYRIDLSKTIEEIRSDFDPKNRNVINKALGANVVTSENSLTPQELYEFYKKTLTVAGANIYNRELKAIFMEFSDIMNSFCQVARYGDEVLGAVFCVYDEKNCYYLLGGLNKSERSQGVNNLLILRSIEMAQQLGCSTFDFEGSMLKGVEKFFRSFGPQLVPYYTVNKAILPAEIMLKFKKRELF